MLDFKTPISETALESSNVSVPGPLTHLLWKVTPFPPEHVTVVVQVWLCILHTLQVWVELLPEAFGVLELKSVAKKAWIQASLLKKYLITLPLSDCKDIWFMWKQPKWKKLNQSTKTNFSWWNGCGSTYLTWGQDLVPWKKQIFLGHNSSDLFSCLRWEELHHTDYTGHIA